MTWLQTASGRAVDLLNVTAEDIDLVTDVAGPLGRIARFGGQVSAGLYSVAQHCVIGAEAILRDAGSPALAAYFLLHDAHEAYVGDETRPLQLAVNAQISALAGLVGAGAAAREASTIHSAARKAIRRRLDAAIHAAAGLPIEALTPARAQDIKRWDDRMLETERRLFLGPCRQAWAWDADPPPTIRWPEKPVVWPWPYAADRYVAALRRLCPDALAA